MLFHQEGGFYSAEDADSLPTHDSVEKKEGAFCVWTKADVMDTLNEPLPDDSGNTHGEVFSFHYDICTQGNVDPYKVFIMPVV